MKTDTTTKNVGLYLQHPGPLWKAEREIFKRLLRPGMSVLDLGCGEGRVARHLVSSGARVWACDLKMSGLEDFKESVDPSELVVIFQADARFLPFDARSLDAVVFAYNGLDFLYPVEDRMRTVKECVRVLKPGGYFIYSSHNPIGLLFSPRGLRSPAQWRRRIHYLLSGSFMRPHFVNPDGLVLTQGTPRRQIEQVRAAGLEFMFASNMGAHTTSRLLITLFSLWPYYVFRRPALT